MKLQGSISSVNLSREGHSQVRVTVPGFGEVILSAPKAALAELAALPDDAAITVTVEHA